LLLAVVLFADLCGAFFAGFLSTIAKHLLRHGGHHRCGSVPGAPRFLMLS
jgi:hypothetical protein